jgi:hypothetical protein
MTKLKWFSRIHNMRKTIRTFGWAIAALTLFMWAPSTRADNAPDWLRAAAQEKTPADVKDALVVFLLDEQQLVVKDKGDIEIHVRQAYRILRPQARDNEYGIARASFASDTKISFF